MYAKRCEYQLNRSLPSVKDMKQHLLSFVGCRGVVSLSLVNCNPSPEHIQGMIHTIPLLNIDRLHMKECLIPKNQVSPFFRAFKNRGLTEIYLKDMNFELGAIDDLVLLFKTNPSLEYLFLQHVLLTGHREFIKFADALHEPGSSLRHLDFHRAHLRPEITKRILQSLPKNHIDTLVLANCDLSDEDIQEVAKVLPESKLTRLSLSGNEITWTGLKEIVSVFRKRPQDIRLKKLNLSKSTLTVNDVSLLMESIQNVHGLTELHLDHNYHSLSPLYELFQDTVKKHVSLLTISIAGIPFDTNHFYKMMYLRFIKTSGFYKLSMTFLSAKIPRIGTQSYLKRFPVELLKMLVQTFDANVTFE